ncbi:Extradiol ring-cleavage dioxygenase, class III enzyme, subunit B [Stachybotrys elegans]|uniref:Extradiol ring-cleavage dioxygenase, class III enzyme, subunit B n=1 Tax=Stachybotrys elegans TaxID=80388 RepID=A0A8K0SKK5_9HYPO|nr:Extradiol ring-cleavage dioxygenase, class III enzyme, subunit B [Stachybotrys elegans]
MSLAPVIALSHGGGPMPILEPSGGIHKDVVSSLKTRVPKILGVGTPSQPRAIVLVTAHWQTPQPTVTSAAKPDLLYDYYGFPAEAYSLKYPAPGEPSVAQKVREAFAAQGFEAVLDPERGWDHGVFVPLLLALPQCEIPIVQVSILASQDASAHLRLGAALAPLRADNIAIVGSGFASFHNLPKMRSLMGGGGGGGVVLGQLQEWNAALKQAVTSEDSEERWRRLEGWRDFPHADVAHPPRGADHFMPLLVAAGAAGAEKTRMYKDMFLGVEIYTFYWGDEVA